MAALLALLSSLLWGGSDFYGGLVSRRLSAVRVVAWSQGIALVAIGGVAVATRAYPCHVEFVIRGSCGCDVDDSTLEGGVDSW